MLIFDFNVIRLGFLGSRFWDIFYYVSLLEDVFGINISGKEIGGGGSSILCRRRNLVVTKF